MESLNKEIYELVHGKLVIDDKNKEKWQDSILEKAEFALELLLCENKLIPPDYIKFGLLSLIEKMEQPK